MATETAVHLIQQSAQAAASATSQTQQTASKQSGSLSRGIVGLAEHIKEITVWAYHNAAKVFHEIIQKVPFPANVILAPIAAAGVFVASMAYAGGGGKSEGGMIHGPGTSTSDSIPTMLSDQEYVVQASTVRALGTGTMDAINRGELNQSLGAHFAVGGVVSNLASSSSTKQHLAHGGIVSISNLSSGGVVSLTPVIAKQMAGGGIVSSIGSFTTEKNVSIGSSSTSNNAGPSFSFPTHIASLNALDGVTTKAMLHEQGETIGKIAIAAMKRYFRNQNVTW